MWFKFDSFNAYMYAIARITTAVQRSDKTDCKHSEVIVVSLWYYLNLILSVINPTTFRNILERIWYDYSSMLFSFFIELMFKCPDVTKRVQFV